MTSASMAVPTRRVDMWYAGAAPQKRVTVVFRIILAIPQFIVLFFIGIAAFVVAVIGWFAALVTGELPEFAHTFLGGVIRWEIRVTAYMYLLTDSYPPFALDDVDYPVRPILPGRGPLNRVSVFFRIVLAIPASVFSQIVINGLTAPLLFVMWIVVIATGSMPPSLYDAYSSLLRYQTRFHAWFSMVTSEYAWGMLGDFVPPPPASSPPPIGAISGSTPATPAAAPPRRPRCRVPNPPHRLRYRLRPSRLPTRRPASRRRRPARPEATPGPPGWPPQPAPRPAEACRVPPAPCPRRHRGSARRSRPGWSRCLLGGCSSCRAQPGPG